MVSFGSRTPRLLIGAHYDAVPGSTGANDNAVGVCILLDLIRILLEMPHAVELDVVFFDLEEGLTAGSEAYISQLTAKTLLGMINLDLCGVGDTMIIAPKETAEQSPFAGGIEHIQKVFPVYLAEETMPSDNIPFEFLGVPTLAISALPQEEIETTLPVWSAMLRHRTPNYIPPIFETMHNGKRDSLACIEPATMSMISQAIYAILLSIRDD